MHEFLKLSWRTKATDEELEKKFFTDEDISDLYACKSFDNPIRPTPKKTIKLHSSTGKYVPGLKYHHVIKRRSLLTKLQKSHCLLALKLIQSGKRQDLLNEREKYSLKVYNDCQTKIVQENQLFNEHIKNVWLKNDIKEMRTKAGIYNYAWNNWKIKMARYLEYPQFYKETESLSLNFEESAASVEFQHVSQPLETGTLARYAHPTLKEQCILKLNTLKKLGENELLNSKLPVSQDENITKLLQNHNFDVVISSSGLKQIIDYTNTKNKWIIPVVIKTVEIVQNDATVEKKIVFIDKVLPKVNPTIHDLNVHTYKRLLKLNFCQYEAFRYPTEETAIETVKEEKVEVDDKDDEELNDETNTKTTNKTRAIHHNVNYRIWNVKKTVQNTLMKNQINEKDINLLLRCKLDGCEATEEGTLYPVVVRPKIEQQIQYGANIPSKSEIARDWTSLFFRLYSVLYRARIYKPMSEIISVEKCSIQKINSEAHTHYEYKPILGLGVLQKILSHLVNLDCGTYILQHQPKQGSFISVMKQCDECNSAYDLYAECADTRVDTETRQNWMPLDVNYILPVHEENNTIPGLFHGFDKIQTDKKFTIATRKKKKKKRVFKNRPTQNQDVQ